MGDDASSSEDEGDRGTAMTLVERRKATTAPVYGGHGTEVNHVHSSQDVPVNLTLQLTRRESLSVIKGGTCRCCQVVPNVRL